MKLFVSFLLLLAVTFLTSCSTCKETKDSGTSTNQNNPTTVTPNVSIVTAVVKEINSKNETDFTISATIVEVQETDRLPSIAVKGNEYKLIPNFRYDNDKLIESDVNDSLKKLGRLSEGKSFKAEISYEYQKGWYIQKVISVE
ncbi:MAG: hypothetical protein IPM56_16900 [Ignavibacteriales bacterium]|nr:MAG: hypothetical protein IPM56_16900 [Ignavibacteriales bacterium]